MAELGLVGGFSLEPGAALGVHAVLDALVARLAGLLLMSLELGHGGEQRPAFRAFEPDMALAAGRRGLEGEPAIRDAVRLRRLAFELELARLDGRNRRLEHLGDGGPSLGRLDVPGEGDEVAPIALLGEQRGRALGVLALQRIAEPRKPSRHTLIGSGLAHPNLPYGRSS